MANEPTVALSIRQPWAWLIVRGWKDVENRTWPTKVRGMIGIHAGKKFDQAGYEWVDESIFFGDLPDIPLPLPDEYERGGIVGRAELHDCVEEHESPWFFGPHGFLVRDAAPIEFRPCRGRLGFFRPEFPTPEAE